MSDIPDDVMETARVLNMQLHSATKLGQKTQWIAEALMDARAKALEEAAKVAEDEDGNFTVWGEDRNRQWHLTHG